LAAGQQAVLAWPDTLCDGPVPPGLSIDQLGRVRAEHWADADRPGWRARSRKIETQFLELNRSLRRFRDFREVILWCSPRVSCQLLLAQMLAWFADQDLGGCKVSIIDSVYAGILPHEELNAALVGRRRATAAHFRLGVRAWKAFTADEPGLLNRLLSVETPELPVLITALLTEAREYPAAGSGLSAMERMLLEDLAGDGPSTPVRIIDPRMVDSRHGYPEGLLTGKLRGFIQAPNQLVRFAEPFRGNFDNFEFNGALLEITEFGRNALADRVDVVCFNGIDRWIGGVHLEGQDCRWRWREKERRIVGKK
jgi:hypothetical protein